MWLNNNNNKNNNVDDKILLMIIIINNNNVNNDNNNNNNNINNNNNNKDLFASSIFTMTLRATEKKNIKTNKNVKIYHYITVNTKNMTTKIVKGLR